MKLTDSKLRTLTTPGKHADGAGLYIEVTATGGKYWRLKYRFGGKEKRLAFGTYPAVGLKEARRRATEARAVLAAGIDPGAARKAAKAQAVHEAASTLETVAREWLEHQKARWAPVTRERVLASLANDLFPALGDRPLAAIKPGEIMAVVRGIERRGAADQAGRVLQRAKAVYRWALAHGRIESNPMVDLVPMEILKPRTVTHRPALPARELPEFLRKLEAYQGDPTTVLAMKLLMLTAVRPGEVRGARWAEIDLDAALWVIPSERMKMKLEHRVPLSRQAIEVLKAMQPLSGDGELVFPSPFYPSKSISENTLNSALARMGFKAVAHGFRALFSTVANECGMWNPDAIERQLAHVERSKVRAAYNRGQYLDERVRMMQWWGDYLDGRVAGNVVPMKRRTA